MRRAISREGVPRFLEPMLCAPGRPVEDVDAVLQLKWDGIRGQFRADRGSGWTLRSRPGADRSDCFPELAALHEVLAGRAVLLDGEVVVLDAAGRPDFAAVRRRLTGRPRPHDRHAVFVAFDVLHVDGEATRERPLRERLALLEELLPDSGPTWRRAEALHGRVDDVLAVVASHQLEGVVAKQLESPWVPGRRSAAWIKHKLRRRHELRVTAWRPRVGQHPDAWFLSHADGRPAGPVSFGLSVEQRAALRQAVLARETGERRGPLRLVSPEVTVTVDAHGADGQLLRDPVLRAWGLTGRMTA